MQKQLSLQINIFGRYFHAKLATYVLLIFFVTTIHGQTIEYTTNAPHSSDVFVKRLAEYIKPGETGTNCLWDFSGIDISETALIGTNKIDSLGRIIITDDRQIAYYIMRGDSLLEIGNENPFKLTAYSRPPCVMKYPMALGDSVSNAYEGYGVYCGDHYFKEVGINNVVVDSRGDIILSEKDTLRNALRVYKLRAYSIAMDMKPSNIDSVQLKQVIEEKYEWYVEGCKRPVFETYTSTSYSDLSPLGTTKYAFCELPDYQKFYNDDYNSDDGKGQSDYNGEEISPDIINYTINVNDNRIEVEYNLTMKANVTMLISNHMGMIYQYKRYTQDKGTGYNAQFDISGLRPGVYVLYINANGKVYNEKISK